MAKTRTKSIIAMAERRASNHAEREARRAEIKRRWNRRQANRVFSEFAATDHEPKEVIWALLLEMDFAPYEDLAEYLRPETFKSLLGYALRVIQLKEMPYETYLQTEEWKKKAATTKKVYHGRCALDASHPADDAHHRTYKRRGRELGSDLIPLCRECHQKFHERHS